MGKIFDTDNFLFRWMSRIGDFCLLSCLWILCSLPVVTIVPASIALYDAISRCVYGSDGGACKRFFRTFRKELGRGIVMTLIWAVAGWFLYGGYQLVCQLAAESTTWTVLSILYFCTLYIPLGVWAWTILLESRFVYSFGALFRNAFIFTLAHLPHTAAIVALLVLAVTVCINFIPLILLIPGLMMFLQAIFAERVMKRYMPEE